MSLSVSKYLKSHFWLDHNISEWILYYVIKHVNIWKTCKTKWINIFQMTNACYKIMHGKRSTQDKPVKFNVTEYEKYDVVSDSTLQLTMCWVLVQKYKVLKNIYNDLKKLLTLNFYFFQSYIHVRDWILYILFNQNIVQ